VINTPKVDFHSWCSDRDRQGMGQRLSDRHCIDAMSHSLVSVLNVMMACAVPRAIMMEAIAPPKCFGAFSRPLLIDRELFRVEGTGRQR
jgi:hypothetical protein